MEVNRDLDKGLRGEQKSEEESMATLLYPSERSTEDRSINCVNIGDCQLNKVHGHDHDVIHEIGKRQVATGGKGGNLGNLNFTGSGNIDTQSHFRVKLTHHSSPPLQIIHSLKQDTLQKN
jgi:hypothetical protein